ncbi:carboxypeptidase regulatory-like domain-containing protein [Roseivirga sp. BDSF3-8]|uniref:carboxypeptidase regulatory-like domain-containing protein n=1 Tax=Roseivirga sp. BDSF3-8 TaxID=3241598 RepID=UPI003531E6CD
MTSILTILTFCLLAIGCGASSQNQSQDADASRDAISQGISGTLIERSGNFMPTPENDTPHRGTEEPHQGTIEVYNPINVSGLGQGPYYKITEEPLHSLKTNEEGHFSVQLSPGIYSLFIKTDRGLYAKTFNGQGIIGPVEVTEGKVTEVEMILDNEATY